MLEHEGRSKENLVSPLSCPIDSSCMPKSGSGYSTIITVVCQSTECDFTQGDELSRISTAKQLQQNASSLLLLGGSDASMHASITCLV